MAQKTKNYAEEEIPNADHLTSKAVNHLEALINSRKYSFTDLFKIQKSGEYYRNKEIWDDLYNNWSKNEYDEEIKSEADQSKKNEVKGIYVFY